MAILTRRSRNPRCHSSLEIADSKHAVDGPASDLLIQYTENIPLPESKWGETPEPVEFSSVTLFEEFLCDIEMILKDHLRKYHYNTFGNFLQFYSDFKRQNTLGLEDFFLGYQAKILPHSLSCVGLSCYLAFHLALALTMSYPKFAYKAFLVSCEEMVEEVESYCTTTPPDPSYAVKEHVLVAIKVLVEGRDGVVLLDPGYHVGCPVVVMADQLYPHTGWFVQSATSKSKKEYGYDLHENQDYIKWQVRETRNGKINNWTNLIYVTRKFLSYIDVSEKRNLVYEFRTLVARDGKQPVAGMYCRLDNDPKFTLFYKTAGGDRDEHKIPFSYFLDTDVNNEHEMAIENVAEATNSNSGYIQELMMKTAEAYMDPEFMPWVQKLNKIID